jgi:DNA repair exonuclease SbcCD ATPase subunit
MEEIEFGSNTTADNYLEFRLDDGELNLGGEDEKALTNLISQYRNEFKKRVELEQELDQLGNGIDFLAVEKLRKDINNMELEIFNTRETIREKTESMENEKAIDQSEIQTEKEGLRTLKKQCEDALKLRKKELKDALDVKRHEMTIDEELREEADMTKKNWEKEVKKLTKSDEDANLAKIEELKQKQEKNIKKQEDKIQTIQDDFDKKYGACEEEIRKLKTSVEKMKIQLHDLEMARINRLAYIHVNETCEWKTETIKKEQNGSMRAK